MNTSKQTGTTKKSATKTKAPRAQKTATRATARSKATKPSTPVEVTPEERWRMIAVAAYHKAEQRGFTPDRTLDDWLEAEKEVNMLLGG
ncbi:MAG: DUF2934 domain-containing protein [Pseudomonadota bacterium]|nr:DUF2934 domain-containing protein [Pseudomonadota bacterium]